ncbi:MAG: hypothetical protein RMA76_13100 [Deltaproteobacteria bacterium]|jgi:hypothetical protein
MKKTIITLATSFALGFALAACGGPDEGVEYDETGAEITVQVGGSQSDRVEGGREPIAPVGNNGYCCNTSTGLVSKTQSHGCDASDETWHSTYADCVNNSICGSNCNIN